MSIDLEPTDTAQALVVPAVRLRHVLQAVEQIMGHGGLVAVLKQAELERYCEALPDTTPGNTVRCTEVNAVFVAIVRIYGRGARGHLLRIGEATFGYVQGWSALRWQMLRLRRQPVGPALALLCAYLNEGTPAATCERAGDGWLVSDPSCSYPLALPQPEDNYFMLGLMQAMLRWCNAGHLSVHQTSNRARGDAADQYRIG